MNPFAAFYLLYLLFFQFNICDSSAIIDFVGQIATQALDDEAAHNDLGKGYQYLAESVLERIHAFYPSTTFRFMVIVARKISTINLHWEILWDYNKKIDYNADIVVLIYSTYATTFFTGTTNCMAELANDFESCIEPDKEEIFQKLEEMCAGNKNYTNHQAKAHISVKAIMEEADLGAASSLPPSAFSDVTSKCSKWRMVMALQQNLKVALDLKTRSKNWFTRLKSRNSGKYMRMEKYNNGGKYSLMATDEPDEDIAKFFQVQKDLSADLASNIRAYANWKYIRVDEGTGKLIADLDNVFIVWRQFEINWLSNRWAITMRSIGNGKYVAISTDSNNTGFLLANKDGPEEAEIFDLLLPEEWGSTPTKYCNESENKNGQHEGHGNNIGGNKAGGAFDKMPFMSAILLAIMAIFLFILISISLLICFFCKYRQYRGTFGVQLHAFWFLHIRNKLDHMLDSTAIDIERSIYSGPNSRVYFGRYFIGGQMREVAVKVPSKEAFNVSMIIEETRINANLRHKRIVEYIGFYEDACKNMRIVSEFMEGGDLHSFLTNHKNHLTIGHLFNFFNQIVEGMEYLASKKIIHRDLAARNCMLTGDYSSIKIADFGLSRHFNVDANYACSSPVRLPLRWTAIECLGQNAEILPNSKFSEKSDVWSFGIVCWECFTRGEMPYGAVDVKDVVGELRDGWRLDRPENCPQQFYDQLMLKCWDGKHEARPTFAMLKLMLGDIFDWLLAYEPDLIMK